MGQQLYIKLVSQIVNDGGRGTAGVLTYTATDIYTQPTEQYIYDYSATNNSAATPFPTFTGDVDARAYFDSIATTAVMADANTAMGAGTYTSFDLELIDAPVQSSIAMLATVARTGNYSDLAGTPAIPTVPSLISAFTNDAAYIDSAGAPVQSVAGRTGTVTLTKSDVGLGNVDNTSDVNKPVSTAQATAISAKLTTPAGTTSQYVRGDASLATFPAIPTVQAYEGTTQRLNPVTIFKSATVASGVAVFNLTNDGTSGGTSLFPNGVIQDSVILSVNDATAAYQMSWAWSNSNKTLTVTTNKLTTANILSGILGQTAANSAVVKLAVTGY